jgi:hypothetical protein
MGNLSELGVDWDSTQEVGELGDYRPMPKGNYEAWVIDSELKPTNAGNGYLLRVTFEVVEGEYMGRKLWTQFNLANHSAKAQQIGRGQWKRLYTAAGMLGAPDDSSEIHEKRIIVKVDVEPQTEINPKTGQSYAPKNVVKDFFAVGKTVPEHKKTPGVRAAEAKVAAPVVDTSADDDTPPWGAV